MCKMRQASQSQDTSSGPLHSPSHGEFLGDTNHLNYTRIADQTQRGQKGQSAEPPDEVSSPKITYLGIGSRVR